ncbi:MAG TPA: CDP-6-deoxy-delta-3,4-glucoseen reductase [Zeimonas sp.]|nr:CDP-6-deoxy-delta-3,4-glucoseen reductase [Zeimonas sp.]
MSFTVTVLPSGARFTVDDDETILDAALRQGIVLPYGCRDGACGSCKSLVVEGEIEQGAHSVRALSRDEQARGMALLCCAQARSDLTVQARILSGPGQMPTRRMPCRIASITRVADDVAVVRLQLPAGERLQYLAGQYVELILRDGTRRSYSMAGAPEQAEQLELHIRHMPGGRFTDALFGAAQPALKERDVLRLEGPLGTFFLREDRASPIVLLASGTGFAPIQAIVEHMRFAGIERPTTLYWGGRRPHDLYRRALCEQWASEMPHLRFIPVVSDALPEDDWRGRAGYVHRAVLEDFPDLSGHQVYACGTPAMVDAAQRDFVALGGLPPGEFYADAFTSAADLAGATA